MSIHSEEKRRRYIDKLVGNARAIITYQRGLPIGCLQMRSVLFWLRPFGSFDYPVFDEYLFEVRALPIGSERLRWNREALRKVDKRLEKVNAKFRNRIFETCYDIIDTFGKGE